MSTLKRAIGAALEDPRSRYFLLVNDTLAFITILSVVVLALATVPSLEPYQQTFLYIEYVAVSVFTIEYILRLWIAKKSVRYVFSFFGIIDFLSILPTYLGLGNFAALKSARVLRILRFLRILRIAKLARSRSSKKRNIFDIKVYFLALFIAILIFASLMYMAEGVRSEFESIPVTMLWSAKVVLGGVPQHIPETYVGELVVIGARFAGLLLFGLLINVMAGSMKQLIFGEKLKEGR